LAQEAKDMPEDKFGDCEYRAPIEYLEVGDREDMLGGPATERGWYLHPECWIGCCKTEGPFPNKKAALEEDHKRWERIAKVAQSENVMKTSSDEIEPF
jgi:hypothetical protein